MSNEKIKNGGTFVMTGKTPVAEEQEKQVFYQPNFLSPAEQFLGIIRYNERLKKKAPKDIISRKEIEELELRIPGMVMNDLIFYGHKNKWGKYDSIRTCGLAWEHICNQRGEGRFYRADDIQFKKEYIGLADGEPERPTGFYTKKIPKEDYESGAIGKRFQERCVEETRRIIRAEGSWSMGSEGLQFIFTHPHYPELMDGDKIPFVNLPGLKVAPKKGVCAFYHAPFFHSDEEANLGLFSDDVRYVRSGCGSGSLL